MKRKKCNITFYLMMCGFIILFLISANDIPHAQSINVSQTQEEVTQEPGQEEVTQEPAQEEDIQEPSQEGVIQDHNNFER